MLCLCTWWSVVSDTSPTSHIDFTKLTLVLPEELEQEEYYWRDVGVDSIIYFDIPNSQPQAHASSIVNVSAVSEADFMLLYFAGSREGARDVGIYQSFFTFEAPFKQENIEARRRESLHYKKQEAQKGKWVGFKPNELRNEPSHIGAWSEPKLLLDAPMLSHLSGKFIKKLGNPVSFVDTQGRVHLFVVGVSMGGWATSKIYWLILESLEQGGLRYVKELHLSPFLNFSFLVRTPPLLKSDGGFILPIYHELASKYPLLLDFSPSLELTAIMRPTDLKSQLQPSFVPLDSHSALGVYRNHKAYNNTLFVSECDSQCKNPKLKSNLKNYDASSVLFNMRKAIYIAHNEPSTPQGNARENLRIYVLDKTTLAQEMFKEVEFWFPLTLDTLPHNEVSYPSVATNKDFVHIAYTYGRKHIRTALVPKDVLDRHTSLPPIIDIEHIQNLDDIPYEWNTKTFEGE